MSKIPCSSCGTPNDEGTRFCTRCGQSQEARVYCPSCNQLQVMGNRFCMSCGATMSGARFTPEDSFGAVVGGVWERAAGELIRRVDPEDCRSFLGARVVRIPAGTVGAVMIDGLVERILPPGEQTTLNLFERIATSHAHLFTHTDEGPDDMPSHIKSALTQCSLTIPVVDEQLALGTWQGIYLFEHRLQTPPRRLFVSVFG